MHNVAQQSWKLERKRDNEQSWINSREKIYRFEESRFHDERETEAQIDALPSLSPPPRSSLWTKFHAENFCFFSTRESCGNVYVLHCCNHLRFWPIELVILLGLVHSFVGFVEERRRVRGTWEIKINSTRARDVQHNSGCDFIFVDVINKVLWVFRFV